MAMRAIAATLTAVAVAKGKDREKSKAREKDKGSARRNVRGNVNRNVRGNGALHRAAAPAGRISGASFPKNGNSATEHTEEYREMKGLQQPQHLTILVTLTNDLCC